MTYLVPYRNLNPDYQLGFHSFDQFFEPRFSSLLSTFFDDQAFSVGRHFNLDETDDAYTLVLELPGFKQADLDVSIEKNVLTVTAKRKDREYQQSLTIPSGVDLERVDAKLEDGLLTLILPKLAVAKPRKIAIK